MAWDLAGALCVLAALGCKNTFAALVPAQLFLRMTPDGIPLWSAWRRHALRAAPLALTLIAPIAHYVYFKLHWRPGQYVPGSPTFAGVRQYLFTFIRAMSLDFLGAGIGLTVVAVFVARRKPRNIGEGRATSKDRFENLDSFNGRYRAAIGAGLLLLIAGIAVYLPMNASAGRYTMPAVWGLDLALALLLTALFSAPRTLWRRTAEAALACGLVATAFSANDKHQKFAAKIDLLWQTLETIEREAPPNARIAWYCGASGSGDIDAESGVHFQWHLAARGRPDVSLVYVNDSVSPNVPATRPSVKSEPTFAFWTQTNPDAAKHWAEWRRFTASYRAGMKQLEGHLGRKPFPLQTAAGSDGSRQAR
jgi:hypothetical protein